MLTAKGTNRFVILLPRLGIVIKIPIIEFRSAAKTVCSYFKRYTFKQFLKRMRKEWGFSVETYVSLKKMLFGGLVANYREGMFYLRTRNSFLEPTYLTLGIINIQRFGRPCPIELQVVIGQLYDLTNGDILKDPHSFDTISNFSFSQGKLRMVDYGSLKVQGVIRDYGEKIIQKFDINYKRDEEDTS